MDMGTSTMAGMATTTATGISSATSTAGGGMSMGGSGSRCKISMLWNWYTIDSCFIARTWHIRSTGMFAGSCIGVILLVMSLEFLRRASKEYDRAIRQQWVASTSSNSTSTGTSALESGANAGAEGEGEVSSSHSSKMVQSKNTNNNTHTRLSTFPSPNLRSRSRLFRPTLVQQVIRATFHMVQFAVAYFVMLLAMYYNGYIIISIFIGAWLGAFVFSWEAVGGSEEKEEVTYCCG